MKLPRSGMTTVLGSGMASPMISCIHSAKGAYSSFVARSTSQDTGCSSLSESKLLINKTAYQMLTRFWAKSACILAAHGPKSRTFCCFAGCPPLPPEARFGMVAC